MCWYQLHRSRATDNHHVFLTVSVGCDKRITATKYRVAVNWQIVSKKEQVVWGSHPIICLVISGLVGIFLIGGNASFSKNICQSVRGKCTFHICQYTVILICAARCFIIHWQTYVMLVDGVTIEQLFEEFLPKFPFTDKEWGVYSEWFKKKLNML